MPFSWQFCLYEETSRGYEVLVLVCPSCSASSAHFIYVLFSFSFSVDIISAIEFDRTGDHLATGDRGGQVVLFERTDTRDVCLLTVFLFIFLKVSCFSHCLAPCYVATLYNKVLWQKSIICSMLDIGEIWRRWIIQWIGTLSFDIKLSFRAMNLRYLLRKVLDCSSLLNISGLEF